LKKSLDESKYNDNYLDKILSDKYTLENFKEIIDSLKEEISKEDSKPSEAKSFDEIRVEERQKEIEELKQTQDTEKSRRTLLNLFKPKPQNKKYYNSYIDLILHHTQII
jgi:hypothetical protein